MKSNNEKELKRFNSKLFRIVPVILIGIVIVFFIVFNYLFNTFTPIIKVENNGFIIGVKVLNK